MSAEQDLHENPLKVCRRLVYLHRLVGDDVLTPKPKVVRPNPWRVAIVFAFYTTMATMSILTYIDVGYLNSVNHSLREVLMNMPYQVELGDERTASDISKAEEVIEWLNYALFPQLLMGGTTTTTTGGSSSSAAASGEVLLNGMTVDQFISSRRTYSEAGALRGFNKVLGGVGFCNSTSVVMVSLRRMKANTDSVDTTTAKFDSLYTETWMGPGIPPGSATADTEDTSDIWGSFQIDPDGEYPVPLQFMGYADNQGTPLNASFFEFTPSDAATVAVKWKYSPPCEGKECAFRGGFSNAGGYIAAVAVQGSQAQSIFLAKMLKNKGNQIDWEELREIASDLYILLLDPSSEGKLVVNSTLGTCGVGVQVTNVMRFEDFVEAKFFDKYTASVTVDMTTYNGNMQTISDIVLQWNMIPAGVVDGPFNAKVDSIKLDLLDSYYVAFEIFYILGTAFYFIELFVYKLYKKSYKLFSEIWTWVNTLSIIASCLSVAFRFQLASKNKSLLVASQTFDVQAEDYSFHLDEQRHLSYLYQVNSAVALVTIWLRLVELLAKTPPRVKLLEQTLIKAMAAVVIYFCYITVVLFGFWAFVSVHFGPYSLGFSHPGKAFISCFEMLCLNVAPYSTTVGAPLRVAFLFPYFLFSIISVQMFNSIINYAYNRVSEDMEPIFKKLARDRKNTDKQQKNILRLTFHYVKRACVWFKGKVWGKSRSDVVAKEGSGKITDKAKDAAPAIEELPANEKEKVEQYNAKGHKKVASDGAVVVCLYFVFALSYIMFLWLALRISSNGMVARNIAETIFAKQVAINHPTGYEYFRSFDQVKSIYEVSYWMRHAIPEIVSEGKEVVDSELGVNFFDPTQTCFKNWNCLVSGSQKNRTHPKMLRITQRLLKEAPNYGLIQLEPDDPAVEERFAYGKYLSNRRGPAKEINAWFGPSNDEDVTTDYKLSDGEEQFCGRDQSGGFQGNGGIVCMLDADPLRMTKQLSIMARTGFFSLQSGTIIAEMISYNGNVESLVHIIMEFTQRPSGDIIAKGWADAIGLLGVDTPEKGADAAAVVLSMFKTLGKLDMLCGVIYMCLVIYFVVGIVRELNQDIYRKKFNENKSVATSIIEYFVLDVFHTLDAASYFVSFASMMFFMAWLALQLDLEGKKGGDLTDFITYVSDLTAQRRMYRSLSTVNLLTVCVRPLKFFRTNATMAKINLTFWLALEDIAWFNVMLALFFMGFVFFAHIIFGVYLPAVSNVLGSMIYCFKFLIGSFDFWELWSVSEWSAVAFVFCFLFLFKFFFLNIFFAIIDKFFVTGEAPPVNLRKKLKPVFGRLCRWIEWDRDLTMEGDASKAAAAGPPSRAGRVHEVAMQIHDILTEDQSGEEGGAVKKSKALSDVCEVDEKMNEVIRWSREEAKAFMETYMRLLADKQEFSNDEVFLKTKVKAHIDKELETTRDKMHEEERHQRYAILVNESLVRRDQEILSKYIMRLEQKITRKKIESHALETDVYHLKAESHKMRFTDDEMKHIALEDAGLVPAHSEQATTNGQAAIAAAPDDDDPSDGDDDDAPEKDGAEAQAAQQGITTNDMLAGLSSHLE
jgi:hypothetical protein